MDNLYIYFYKDIIGIIYEYVYASNYNIEKVCAIFNWNYMYSNIKVLGVDKNKIYLISITNFYVLNFEEEIIKYISGKFKSGIYIEYNGHILLQEKDKIVIYDVNNYDIISCIWFDNVCAICFDEYYIYLIDYNGHLGKLTYEYKLVSISNNIIEYDYTNEIVIQAYNEILYISNNKNTQICMYDVKNSKILTEGDLYFVKENHNGIYWRFESVLSYSGISNYNIFLYSNHNLYVYDKKFKLIRTVHNENIKWINQIYVFDSYIVLIGAIGSEKICVYERSYQKN